MAKINQALLVASLFITQLSFAGTGERQLTDSEISDVSLTACDNIAADDGKAILIKLKTAYGVKLEDVYLDIDCNGRKHASTLLEYGLSSTSESSIRLLLKYFAYIGKKRYPDNPNYYLNKFLNAKDANGETLLDFVQWKINNAPQASRKGTFRYFYKIFVEYGARRSSALID